jgi:hypothetical protein
VWIEFKKGFGSPNEVKPIMVNDLDVLKCWLFQQWVYVWFKAILIMWCIKFKSCIWNNNEDASKELLDSLKEELRTILGLLGNKGIVF